MSERANLSANTNATEFSLRWQRLCGVYLPFKADGTFWRFSRVSKPQEAAQGWKLHISATILEACDLFEKDCAVFSFSGLTLQSSRVALRTF